MKKVTNKVDVGRNALTDEAIVKNSLVVQRNPITFYAEGDGDTPTLNAILDAPSIMDDAEPQETPETPTETPNETTSQESTETPTTETPDSQTTETPEGESEQALKAFAEQAGGVDVNDKGELVDAEGKVVKTAEETEAALKEYNDNISQENAPFIDSFQRLMGYEIKDQQGNLVSYEDTEKGLIDYTKAVIDQQTYKTQQEFLDSIPGIREYAEFMNRGGSPKEYFERYVAPQTNWRGIQVEEGEQHETKHYNIVKSALMARGFNEERAIQQTDLIKDAGKLYETAVLDQKELAQFEQQQEEQRAQQEQQRIQTAQKEQEDYWNGVQKTIQNGVVGNVQIPEADKEAFYKYMAYATDQYGRSQAMIDAENASVEDTLMLEYLRYKGFDLKSLVQTAAQTQRVQSLRDRIKKSVKVGNSGQHSPEFTQQDPSGEGVSLDNIL